MHLLLSVMSYLLFVLGLPFFLGHPKLRHGFRERFGFIDRKIIPPIHNDAPRIWLHGASAGDIQALLSTVRELRAMHPEIVIIASTITNSGRAMAEQLRSHFDCVIYLPYDLPGAVSRTLTALKPDMLILEYTELWPQLVNRTAAKGIPVILHNGRISGGNLKRYRTLFILTGNLLARLRLLLMRNDAEAERAITLGALPSRVHVTGDTKFDNLNALPHDAKLSAVKVAAQVEPDDVMWVAGSTHEGEEEKLLDTYVVLRSNHPHLRLIIAPRYAERAERVAHAAERRNLSVRLRSQAITPSSRKPDVVVLDTIGELAACYALGTLVFVGGSLVPHGGHNILEPAACGKPVLFGPYMDNFAEPVRLLLGHGGVQVGNSEQLQRVMNDLLSRRDYRDELGNLAQQSVASVRGAALRNAQLITAELASIR